MTVFLTTQYLEEADVLADRVGIIDHGRIVAEGTPADAQGARSAADRRGRARDPGRPRARAGVLERFGEPSGGTPRGRRGAPGAEGVGLADVVRALDGEGSQVATSSCTRRRSTTCSSRRRAARSRAARRRRTEAWSSRRASVGDQSRA